MKDRDGNEWRLVPVNATEEMIAEMLAAKDFDSIWPAAIAAAPQFVAGEVTDEMAHRIAETVFNALERGRVCANDGRQMIAAVRSELGPALGLETQRHRDNEIDALEQKLARADARIAEMERDNERIDAQWRDELRIYRETENARIAELEQAVTVRDTEIARLETDLELARRDAARYRWLRDESGNDHHTPWCAVGYSDPTWLTGEHLDAAIDEARAGNGESCDAV